MYAERIRWRRWNSAVDKTGQNFDDKNNKIFCDTAQNLIAMNYAVIVIKAIIALGFIGKALKYSDVY